MGFTTPLPRARRFGCCTGRSGSKVGTDRLLWEDIRQGLDLPFELENGQAIAKVGNETVEPAEILAQFYLVRPEDCRRTPGQR